MKTEFERGKKEGMAQLVEYASKAIVSKTLINKESGTVTLFAFDKGEGLSEHTAPYDAMVQILDGSALIRIGGTDHQVGTGEFIIMPADIPHALDATEPFKMLLTMIKSC